jgi:hypothetical protein
MSTPSHSFIQPLERRTLFTALPTSQFEPPVILLGDLNGDGKADLVAAKIITDRDTGRSKGFLSVQLGNGDGAYRKRDDHRGSVDLTPEEFAAMCIGDIDNDQQPDLIIAPREAQTGKATGLTVIDVTKDGAASARRDVWYSAEIADGRIVDIAVGDLDGDGFSDLTHIIWSPPDPRVGVPSGQRIARTLWGIGGNADGTPAIHPATIIPLDASADCIFTGDVDGDGLPDLVAAKAQIAPRPRTGTGITFTLARFDKKRNTLSSVQNNPLYESSVSLSNTQTIALADMNDDGRADLVGRTNNTVTYSSFNTAKLIWSPRSNLSLYGNTSANLLGRIAVGDVNGDGLTDIEAQNPLEGSLLYYQATKQPNGTLGIVYKSKWRSPDLAII